MSSQMTRGLALFIIGGTFFSCADNIIPHEASDTAPDAASIDSAQAFDAAPPGPNPLIPMYLADTGLYIEPFLQLIAPTARPYTPQTELWVDGATKQRWIELPPNTMIDSSNMDFWIYPEGTKIWKQFSRGGLKVETRLLWKQGPTKDDWRVLTYAWNQSQTDAVLVNFGVTDALGTGHEIPSLIDCRRCHNPQPDFILGYAAISIDGPDRGYGLAKLVEDGRLTNNPAGTGPVFLPIPGNDTESSALAYLHANCGGCHFEGSEVFDIVPLSLRLETNHLTTVVDTPTYQSTVGVPPSLSLPGVTSLIEAQTPAASAVSYRMHAVDESRMPLIGSSEVDLEGTAIVDAWISGIPAAAAGLNH